MKKKIEVEEVEPISEQSINYNQSYNTNNYDERYYGNSYINNEEEEDLGLTTQINFNSNEIEFANDDIEATQKIKINEINDELLLR